MILQNAFSRIYYILAVMLYYHVDYDFYIVGRCPLQKKYIYTGAILNKFSTSNNINLFVKVFYGLEICNLQILRVFKGFIRLDKVKVV